MTEETSTSSPRAGGKLRLLLFLSLALNLALVGFLAGAFLRAEHMGHAPGRSPGLGAFGAPYVLALPQEERRAMRRALAAGREDALPTRDARRRMFREVVEALKATPFDEDALRGLVARQAEVSSQVQRHAQEAWLEVVAAMDARERAAYAARVEEILSRGPGRR